MDSISIHNLKEIQKEKCIICKNEATGIIRKNFVCAKHYGILQRDNFYRFMKGIMIPSSFTIYKPCLRNKCANRFLINLRHIEKKLFCSDECKEKEQALYKNGI